jgi:hypothetical protein
MHLGGESKGKEPQRVHAYIPHQIPKRPEIAPRKLSRKGSENHQKKQVGTTHPSLRNHAESSIDTKKVQTRSSLPPDHPSLSQGLTMKFSS